MSSRRAALARMRAARDGTTDRLDSISNPYEEDIYEQVDEEQYKTIVEKRREQDDFVVDDDGLGYYDDGEERLGDEAGDDEYERKKKRSQANAGLTAKALKKARRQHLSSTSEAANTSGNKSMWDFLSRAPKVTHDATNGETPVDSRSMFKKKPVGQKDVDTILNELDSVDLLATRTTSGTRRGKRTFGRSSRSKASRSVSLSVKRSSNLRSDLPAHSNRDEDYANDTNDNFGDLPNNDDNDDDIVAGSVNTDSPPPSQTIVSSVTPAGTPKTVRFVDDMVSQELDQELVTGTDVEKETEVATTNTVAPPLPPAKPRQSRLNQISEGARRAIEEKQKKLAKEKEQTSNAVSLTDISAITSSNTLIASAESVASISTSACLQDYITKAADSSSEDYIDMFWMDLCERNGDIMLFGKVHDPKTDKFVSACAIVQGNKRNLFFLPRQYEDGSTASFEEVYTEVGELIKASGILPIKAGVSRTGKKVKRSYAFGDVSIPREETEYIKVVYDAAYPVPDENVCIEGGKSYSKIMGAGASTMENFIIKRQLMGPCWIRITRPVERPSSITWCKLEFNVTSPKSIKRLDLVKNDDQTLCARPPPVVTTVSLQIKTVTNPTTHSAEIVSLCAVCHESVQLDAATDADPAQLSQVSIIRPVGALGSTEFPRFPRNLDAEVRASMSNLKTEPNERALLSRFLVQLGSWDPDVIVGHNAWGYDLEVLIKRCIELKLPVWSKLGRRRRMDPPSVKHGVKDWDKRETMVGRLVCDTYLSAKELLMRETTYSLTNLAETQLGSTRYEIEPADVYRYFENSKSIVQLAQINLDDARLVHQLMLKLQILPLTKQLTCVAGNIWSHTLKSNRAERTEYLLLHEFHRLKYLAPEKQRHSKTKDKTAPRRGKAKFSGGLVLEPKKGLYNSFILLLDFNSLYPSIIQEYNLCFTTIDWAKSMLGKDGEEDVEGSTSESSLPDLPSSSLEQGVLPRVIKSLVDRRRIVKGLMKKETNPTKKEELNIRQTALKLTANSMYGCLGFSNSRFFAQPIAAMVTMQGRETLQRTVELAQTKVGLDVIYGDTDSIMINTRIDDESELGKVKELGERVKREVNRLYKTLELEIDGIFRTMLLLQKKKYAARTVVEETPTGIRYGQELKGLDLVRRDWCIQSRDSGKYVTEQILSGQDHELVIGNITTHLVELSEKMRSGNLPLEQYVITKGLSKHPKDYPDAKSQPHVLVAMRMLENNRIVNMGDHIPYVITVKDGDDDKEEQASKKSSYAARACHPEEITRSNGNIKPDIEWYLSQQILPPITRLCDPIEGLTQEELALRLGLNVKKYASQTSYVYQDDNTEDYVPDSALPDSERFKDVAKFHIACKSCKESSEFRGVFFNKKSEDGKDLVARGIACPKCNCEFWGCNGALGFRGLVTNLLVMYVRELKREYYAGEVICQECNSTTRQLSACGSCCLYKGCPGTVLTVVTAKSVYTSLKYLEGLFDLERACRNVKTDLKLSSQEKGEIVEAFDKLHAVAKMHLKTCAYGTISASFWDLVKGKQVE